jgi:hypothetical protein
MSENVHPTDPQRERFAELFAAGEPLSALCIEFGLTERTLRRWLADPAVRAIIVNIRAANLSTVSGRLQARLQRALDRLDTLIEDEDARVALAAVRLAIDATLKVRVFEEMDNRIAVIEKRLGIREPVGVS